MPGDGRYSGKHDKPVKYDPAFQGPVQNRGCTDIVCCVLLILAILGYVAVGVLAWSRGDPSKVIYPTDSRGEYCGKAGTPLESKPLLFYFDIAECTSLTALVEFYCPTTQVCVEQCPDKFMTLLEAYSDQKDFDYFKKFCKEDVATMDDADILKSDLCPAELTPSSPFTHRCFPALDEEEKGMTVRNSSQFNNGSREEKGAKDVVHGGMNDTVVAEFRQVVMKICEDYTKSWYWILIGLVIAMVTSLLFIILLRFLAGIMVCVMIGMVILVIGCGIIYCCVEYAALKGEPDADVTLQELGFESDLSAYLQMRQIWLAFMIILAIVEVIIILLLIFLRKRIMIAIALIKEAGRAIGHVMSSLFYPLFTSLLLAMIIACWASTAIFLSSLNEPIYKIVNETTCDHAGKTCDPANYSTSPMKAQCPDSACLFGGETLYRQYLLCMQLYNTFVSLWCANFVTALGQMTLAGAFASYYWAFVKPDDIPAFPVLYSLGRALRYHSGTLAFGSVILSVFMLQFLGQRLNGAKNRFAKFLLCCLKWCSCCMDQFIQFLNRNAYIMVAIHGQNFCTSARDAFLLLMRNIVRVTVLDRATDFLFFLGKLLIVGLVGIFSFFFFSGTVKAFENTAPTLHYSWVPTLTVVIGSYLISSGFFSVYTVCVETLFLCFLEDLERNDGSAEMPYLMPESLRKVLKLKNNAEPAHPRKKPKRQKSEEMEPVTCSDIFDWVTDDESTFDMSMFT